MASLFANNAETRAQIEQRPAGHMSTTGDWIPDDEGNICNRCFKQIKAGIFTSGKHHCRRCGQMICGNCSKNKISLARLGQGNEPVRVCDHCCKHEARRTACLSQYIPKLMQGSVFTKYPGQDSVGMGKSHPRVVRLSSDQLSIVWHKQGESIPKSTASIKVNEITGIQPNLTSQKARRTVEQSGKNNCCFSVVAASRSLDLECNTPEERDGWMQCFGEFVQYAKLETPEVMRAKSQLELDKQAHRDALKQERKERQKHRDELRAKYAK